MISNELNVKPRTLFCRDNLDILQGINSECINLIYLDPPFNKKKIFTAPIGSSAEGAAFSDIFREEDIKDEWVKTIQYENVPLHEYLEGVKTFSNRYNYCYLVYMAVRIIECHRVLKPTGSIYLHCDPTMSHYLKILLDCIFGETNFRNEIVWHYRKWTNAAKYFQRNHDVLLFYTKSQEYAFHKLYGAPTKSQAAVMQKGYNVNKVAKGLQLLVYDRERYAQAVKEGKVDVAKYVQVVDKTASEGTALNDAWEIPWLHSQAKERTGYPTQKPLALLKRIIHASSHEGDVVLDPFCGCATTCIAAEVLGRKWIGIDVSHKAYDLVRERLQKEVPPDLFRGSPHFDTKPPKRTGDESIPQGNVYIISNPAFAGDYKVGIAKDVAKRLNSYQTSGPRRDYRLEYSLLTPHYKEIEKYIHAKFESNHEWVLGTSLKKIKAAIETYAPNAQESS